MAVVAGQGVTQHLCPDVSQVMQSDHRRRQCGKRVAPGKAVLAGQGVRRSSPMFISAVAIVSIHDRLLFGSFVESGA
jgi:hypothetical protein